MVVRRERAVAPLWCDIVTLTSVGVMAVSFWLSQMKTDAAAAINAATNNAPGNRKLLASREPSGPRWSIGFEADVSATSPRVRSRSHAGAGTNTGA